MNWLKRRWLRYTHEHDHEIVACASYIHVNKFTGAEERFLAVWLRCACGHQRAEAIINSYTITTHVPIDINKWHRLTVPLAASEQLVREAAAVKPARVQRPRQAVLETALP